MSHHWGYVAVLFSAILFGIGTTVNKILLIDNLPPLFIAAMTYLLGGVLLASANFLPRIANLPSWIKPPTRTKSEFVRNDLILILLVTLCGGVLAPYLYLLGLRSTTAVSAALLGNTESLFTLGIAFMFFRERGKLKDYTAMMLLIVGAMILTTNLRFRDLRALGSVVGNVLVISSCLFWGIDNNLSRLLSVKRSILQLGALKEIIGGAILLAVALFYGLELILSPASLAYLAIVGFFSVGLSLLLFLFSLQEIGAMRTGVIFSTSSLFGALSAFLVLRESMSEVQVVAGFLMLAAIYVLSIPVKKRVPT